jgi:Trk K+ transport system NAD-binding subunit
MIMPKFLQVEFLKKPKQGASRMDMYDSLFSPGHLLNEQIARQVFDVLPEQGPVMVIIDREGNCWPSDSERFSEMNISESFLEELCAKIDDGAEPVVTQVNDCSIIAAQLTTEQTNCGYVIIALPQYSPESTLANIDLIEILLSQVSLIARLIEKNGLLYELQMKHFSGYEQSGISLN